MIKRPSVTRSGIKIVRIARVKKQPRRLIDMLLNIFKKGKGYAQETKNRAKESDQAEESAAANKSASK